MAATSRSSHRFFSLLILAASLFFTTTVAEIRSTEIRSDARSTIPFDEFGFTHSGGLDLNVSQISPSPNPKVKTDLTQVGFFLCTRDSWLHVLEQIQDREITCTLQSNLIKRIFTFDQLNDNNRFDRSFKVADANQFTLVFANCVPDLQISMNVHSAMYNFDPKSGHRDYLSAGKTVLPSIYFMFFLIYSSLAGIWIYILYNKRLSVFHIHFFMLAVVVLKALNLLCETEDKSYIKRTGTAHGWDVLFYIFSFLKGITLFTLIVLIGTGWSFLKPYLQSKEKRVLMIVIPLQVVANVAQVVLDETGPFGQDSYTWKQVFLLVDVICCCAVLFPIVWSIKNLREAARTDGKAAVNLMKLTLFRQYYIVVICYIYFTRVVVYALETITSYRYQWTSVVAGELVTLAFYVFTAYNFRPKVHNPYFALDDDEEEAAAEALKLEDEFEL
uniref:Protein GPR107-like n=1 Tax=Davidia involucrata TaxID=16924 RepID=A0A5B7BKF9_DAVIN